MQHNSVDVNVCNRSCKAVSGDDIKSSRTVALIQNSDACELIASVVHLVTVPWDGSIAERLACWTQAQKSLGSNRSCNAIG